MSEGEKHFLQSFLTYIQDNFTALSSPSSPSGGVRMGKIADWVLPCPLSPVWGQGTRDSPCMYRIFFIMFVLLPLSNHLPNVLQHSVLTGICLCPTDRQSHTVFLTSSSQFSTDYYIILIVLDQESQCTVHTVGLYLAQPCVRSIDVKSCAHYPGPASLGN